MFTISEFQGRSYTPTGPPVEVQQQTSLNMLRAANTFSKAVKELSTLFNIRHTEVNNAPVFNSTARENDILNPSSLTQPSQIQTTFLNEMSQTFKDIRTSFDSNTTLNKNKIKRDYKLTKK